MNRKRHSDIAQSPSVDAQHDVLKRFRKLLPSQAFAELLLELERPLYPAIRLNPRKATPHDLTQWAERYGWQLEAIPFCSLGWWIKEAAIPVSQTVEHRFGYYYIQEAASMLPAELFDFTQSNQPLILDMAASPGGKTTHLISRSQDQGLVIANDSSAARLTALRLVLQNWGALNVAITNFPGERFGIWFPEKFDAVLLDAPCSMQGLRSSESHPMRPISDRERDALAKRQVRMLESALRAVRVGGQVVYSTCTLTPEENEGVIDEILRQYRNAIHVEDVDHLLTVPAPGLIADESRTFDSQIQKTIRLWPHLYHTAGFYAARLTKIEPIGHQKVETPGLSFSFERAGFALLSEFELTKLVIELKDVYGFDLRLVLDEYDLSLWRRRQVVYALPNRYFRLFKDLPVQGLGMILGEETPQGFVPAHEWVTLFYRQFKGGWYHLPDERKAAWLRGEDLRDFSAPGYPLGKVVLVKDAHGQYIGLGKVVSQRLKNLLPRRIVL